MYKRIKTLKKIISKFISKFTTKIVSFKNIKEIMQIS
jgi:hypothetical protein